MIDLDALEAKARAATPGPWEADSDLPYARKPRVHGGGLLITEVGNCEVERQDEWEANAAHIAALNPVVALALIARIRELEAERDIVKRFMAMVWRWCNRPNVTDAERISFIRHHPTLEKWVEPPDDAYRDSVPEAARISKEAADANR